MSVTNRGVTVVTLGDEEFTLSPTLDAVRKIEARFGGLRAAIAAMGELSVDATSHVLAAGAGLKPKVAQELPDKVFQAGVSEVAPALLPYLLFLLNPSRKDDEDESGNEPAAAAQS